MPDELRDGELGELLRAALSGEREAGSDAVARGEGDALAAFRAARDAGLHAVTPARDLDDWTPVVERRRPRRPLKALVAALVASVTLGGVAVATGDLPEHLLGTPSPTPEPRSTRSVPDPAPAPTGTDATAGGKAGASRFVPPGTTAPLRPEKDPPEFPGKSRDALCRVFEKGDGESGRKAPKSAAWRRLVAAAGGEEHVPEYCRNAPRPARTPSAGPHPNEGGGRGAPGDRPGRGPERPRTDRP
ncbi:hypothetical protein [Streptomyces vietnamensis]|uniref:hypothetical protein n=1 Tax=Streptomyces vietnamensis TaxID=362257 RepID=UPI003424C623